MQTWQKQNMDMYAKTHAQTHKYTSILIFGAIAIEGITPALYCLAPDQTGFITFKASPEPTQSKEQ